MGLVDRVKNILLKSKQEWEVIDGEAATVGSLYTGYIIPLAAIGPICTAIGYSVFGHPAAVRGNLAHPDRLGRHQRRGDLRVDARRGLRARPHHRQSRPTFSGTRSWSRNK